MTLPSPLTFEWAPFRAKRTARMKFQFLGTIHISDTILNMYVKFWIVIVISGGTFFCRLDMWSCPLQVRLYSLQRGEEPCQDPFLQINFPSSSLRTPSLRWTQKKETWVPSGKTLVPELVLLWSLMIEALSRGGSLRQEPCSEKGRPLTEKIFSWNLKKEHMLHKNYYLN